MPALKAYLIGWRGEPPRLEGFEARTVPIAGMAAALLEARGRRGALVLVLGEDALRALRPSDLPRFLALARCAAVGAYRNRVPEEALEWLRSRLIDVIHESALETRLIALSRALVRPEVPEASWVPSPPRPGTLAARIAQAIPRLAKPAAGALASFLDVERHAVLRECRTTWGITTKALCWRFPRAVAEVEAKQGIGLDDISRETGYAGPRSLRRAYRRRGEKVPKRHKPG